MKMLFPIVTADVALFTLIESRLRVLLVQRAEAPSSGDWALPGSILMPDEDGSLDDTARRTLASKACVNVRHLEQVSTFSGPERDPRGWSVTTLFYALLPKDQIDATAGVRIDAIKWCRAENPEYPLAFDHAQLLQTALKQLREKVRLGALPLHLLAEKFTLSDVQRACEAIAGRPYDKGAFRRQIRNDPALVVVEGEFLRGAQRPAQVYRAAADFSF